MRFPTRSLALLLSLVGAASGCGDTGASPVVASAFPLRVLEERASRPGDEHNVYYDELDSLEHWWAVAPGADGLPRWSPASSLVATGALQHTDGHVVLPPGTALLRRVELEATGQHALSARLRGPRARRGEKCPNLFLLPARSGKGKVFVEEGAMDEQALKLLAQAFADPPVEAAPEDDLTETGGTWRQDVTPDDFALARWTGYAHIEQPRGPARWLTVIALGAPLEVDRVRVVATPVLHFGSDTSTSVPLARHEATIERVRVGGDSRLAAIVPAGEVLGLPVTIPPQAVDIVLGTCPDPAVVAQLAPGETRETRWRVLAQPGNHLLAEQAETLVAGKPAGFTDHIVPWPAGLQGEITLEFGVLGAASVVFGQPRVRGPQTPETPSLLFVSIDTLRADRVGFGGQARPTTPYLDELAARGCVFTDTTAVSSYTLPTHASMFTGVFPPRHLALDTLDRLNTQRTPTLALLLSGAGYYTAGFTGGGFMSGDYGFDAGFDRYSTVDPITAPKGQGMDAIATWIRRQTGRSWFAFVHTYAVHDYLTPPEDMALFERAPPPPGFDVYELIERNFREKPPTAAELDRLVDMYDASLHWVDRRLRELLEPLRAEGLLDGTWIIVTSDHGEEFFEHGQLRHRGTLFEELVRVPLLIVPPARAGAAGRRVDEPVSQVDVFATLLELLGQPVPAGGDGRSLAAFVRGGRPAGEPTPLYGHIDRSMARRSMLRAGSWKLVRSELGEPLMDEWSAFDLAQDAGERVNLASGGAEPVAALRTRLGQLEDVLHSSAGARNTFQPGEDLMQRLVELGYVEAGR